MADGAPSFRPEDYSLGARLEALLDILAGEGLVVGPRERTAAHLLAVRAMESEGSSGGHEAMSPEAERAMLAKMAPVLAPLLARTREERERFLRVMATLYPPEVHDKVGDSVTPEREAAPALWQWARKNWVRLAALAVLMLAVAIAVVILFPANDQKPVQPIPGAELPSDIELTSPIAETAPPEQPQQRPPQTSNDLLDRVMAAANQHDGAPTLREIAQTVALDEESLADSDATTGPAYAPVASFETYSSAAFSPDGSRIASVPYDNTVNVRDADSGTRLVVLSGHAGNVLSVAFSPDGSRIVTGSGDGTARIWDARTGASLAVLSGHSNAVFGVAFSPDGSRIATASADRTARIWDARNGAELVAFSGHLNAVWSATFSPDGARVVTASADTAVRMWDASSGASLAVLSGHTGTVFVATFSPDGSRIVSNGEDGARMWDARTGASLPVAAGEPGRVLDIAFVQGRARVATESDDNSVRVLDAESGASLVVLSGPSDRISSVTFSTDGTYIVTTSEDGIARVWDANSGASLGVIPTGSGSIQGVVLSPAGRRILTASDVETATLWEPPDAATPARWTATTYAERLSELTGLPIDRPLALHGTVAGEGRGLVWARIAQALGRIEQPGLEPTLDELEAQAETWLATAQRPRAYRILDQLAGVYPRPESLVAADGAPLTPGAIATGLIAGDAAREEAARIGEGPGEDIARAFGMAGYPTGAFGRLPWEPPAVRPASSPPPGWLPWVALALPLLAALWLARSLFLMRPYLRRRPPRIPPTHTELVSEAGKRAATDAGHFQRIAQRLRVRTPRPSSELDISATIAATLKSGGLIVEPVQARARARPDYLVLVERMAAGDHDAMRMQRLVERLSDLVDLDIYAFQYDPGEIEPWGGGRRISIEEAQARHADHRLIVLGTGAGFLDPLTLEPREAAAKLMYWQRRVLLTPVPLAEWGREEYALAEGLAMPVGRATAEGLQFLAELLGLEGGEAEPQPDPRGDGLARPLPEMLRLRPQRFLFNNPPGKATVEALMAELHNVLTPAEFDWFAALAVYPTIQWDLTLFLGVYLPLRETDAVVLDPVDVLSELQKLHAPAEPLYSEQRLAAIAQMPWLRLGRMPNWLRTRLIAELSPKRAAQVKLVLQKALESSRLRESATKEEEAVFRIAEDRVRNEPRKEALPPERVFDDDVLLDFLARSNRGDFSVPRLPKIDGRFLRDIWRRLGGPVGLAGLAALAFGIAGFALAPRGPDAVVTGAYGPLLLLIVGAVLTASLWQPETMGRRLAGLLERVAPGAFAVGAATLTVALILMTPFAAPMRDALFLGVAASPALAPAADQAWLAPLVLFVVLSILCGAFLLLGRWLGERLRLRIYAPPLNSIAAWLVLVGKSVALGVIAFVLVRLSGSGTPASISITWPLAALVIAAAGVALARFAPEADAKSQGQVEKEPASGWMPLVLRGALAALPIGAAVALSLSITSAHHRAAIVAGEGDAAVATRPERVAIAPGGEAIVSADAAGLVVLSRADGSMIAQASAQAPLSALEVDGAQDAWHVAFADAEGRVFLWPAGAAPQPVEHDGAVLQSRGAPAQLALSPDGGLLAAVEAINAEGRGETRVVAIGASPAAVTVSAPPAALAELVDGAWALATLDGGLHRITGSSGAALQAEAFGWDAGAAAVRPPIRQIQVADAMRLTAVGIDGSLMQATATDGVWSDLKRAGSSPALALGPAEVWRNAPAATGSAAAPVQTQPDRRVATGPWPQNADAVFEEAIQFVLKWEAGYVDSPNDPDGRTKFGITQRSYDAYREKEGLEPAEVRDASAEEARDIYRIGFWDVVSAESMPNDALAIFLLDAAVNHGTSRAIRFLQTAVGQSEDGKVGPATLARARNMSETDPAGLFNNLFAARERFMRGMVERSPAQQSFLQGWLRRLTDLRQYLQPRIDRLTPAAPAASTAPIQRPLPLPQQQVQQQAACPTPLQAVVYFELDRATIIATNMELIRTMLSRARGSGCTVGPVELTASIDPNENGSSALANRRVTAVRDALVSEGVDSSLIQTSVEGDRQQTTQNDVVSEPLNRRVTVSITSVPDEPDPVLTAGTTFRDRIRSAPQTAVPEMVVIPAGSFLMGSPGSEAGREDDETLPATVRIPASFAVSTTEITWDEYLACVSAGACKEPASDMGWGRGNQPVVTVSWTDARAYVTWLSNATGQTYRLLTEAEWEYAARAGSTTAYPWGARASHEYANYGADRERDGGIAQGRDKWVNTSPVRSFPANDFGLYDMHGNLYEWVEDCYEQKPSLNQRPMQRSGCTNYVLRGGSWFDAPRWIRSADRYYGGVNQRNENFGIRVARDL